MKMGGTLPIHAVSYARRKRERRPCHEFIRPQQRDSGLPAMESSRLLSPLGGSCASSAAKKRNMLSIIRESAPGPHEPRAPPRVSPHAQQREGGGGHRGTRWVWGQSASSGHEDTEVSHLGSVNDYYSPY